MSNKQNDEYMESRSEAIAENCLYVKSMGRLIKVTSIFKNQIEANNHMNKTNEGVVCEYFGLIFLADCNDKGIKI